MKVWKDKEGKEVDSKEFMERWKKGINEVTPIQNLGISIYFQTIMTLGFLLGFGVAIWNFKTMWWLAMILFGGFGMNFMQLKGLRKQLKTLKSIENELRDDGKDNDSK
jgi:hypothetical protein